MLRPLWYSVSKAHNITAADASDVGEGHGEGPVIDDGGLLRELLWTLISLNGDWIDGHPLLQTACVRVLYTLQRVCACIFASLALDSGFRAQDLQRIGRKYKMMDAVSNIVK